MLITWVKITSLILVCLTTTNSSRIPREERDSLTLRINEVRKVTRDRQVDDRSRDHNVKVVLDDHDPIPGVERWTLAFSVGQNQILSYLDVDENMWSEQKEFVFETQLIKGAKAVFITAKGVEDNLLAVGMATFGVPVMDSKLSWVGSSYDPSSSSLRVDPGTQGDIAIQGHMCTGVKAPCYILKKELPEVLSRCQSVSDQIIANQMELCDDTMSPFRGLEYSPKVNISSDFVLELTLTLPLGNVVKAIEAVVYDPSDPDVVFSPDKFACNPKTTSGTERKCIQRLNMKEEREHLAVLVVVVYPDGMDPQSSLILLGDYAPKVRTGAIVGGVVGGLLGLVLIMALVFFTLRWRKSKKNKKEFSGRYNPTRTSDPVET